MIYQNFTNVKLNITAGSWMFFEVPWDVSKVYAKSSRNVLEGIHFYDKITEQKPWESSILVKLLASSL